MRKLITRLLMLILLLSLLLSSACALEDWRMQEFSLTCCRRKAWT